jgi:transposase
MRNALELVEADSDRLEEVLRRAEQALDEKDAELNRAVFDSYAYVTELVEDKNSSIRRLRLLLFGARTEKTESVVGQKTKTPDAAPPCDAAVGAESTAGEGITDVSNAAAVSKGHGRNGAATYPGAERIDVPHPSLRVGDACRACGGGTVYDKARACGCESPGSRR